MDEDGAERKDEGDSKDSLLGNESSQKSSRREQAVEPSKKPSDSGAEEVQPTPIPSPSDRAPPKPGELSPGKEFTSDLLLDSPPPPVTGGYRAVPAGILLGSVPSGYSLPGTGPHYGNPAYANANPENRGSAGPWAQTAGRPLNRYLTR
jgi:hypothetical protein